VTAIFYLLPPSGLSGLSPSWYIDTLIAVHFSNNSSFTDNTSRTFQNISSFSTWVSVSLHLLHVIFKCLLLWDLETVWQTLATFQKSVFMVTISAFRNPLCDGKISNPFRRHCYQTDFYTSQRRWKRSYNHWFNLKGPNILSSVRPLISGSCLVQIAITCYCSFLVQLEKNHTTAPSLGRKCNYSASFSLSPPDAEFSVSELSHPEL
jgi:hypothetical protein